MKTKTKKAAKTPRKRVLKLALKTKRPGLSPWSRTYRPSVKEVIAAANRARKRGLNILARHNPKIVPINNDPVSRAIRRVRVIKTLQGMSGRHPKNQYTAVYFVDHSGDWRWGMFCTNRNEVACSGEGYRRIAGAQNGLRNLVKWLKTNDPVEIVKKDFRG